MKQPLGVLVVHGFTGYRATVEGILPHLDQAELPHRMPCLRGHWTRPEDLIGVTARDWFDDVNKGLDDLLTEVDQAIVVGLSLGGILSLWLSMERARDLAGVVGVAPCLRFADPLAGLTPFIAPLIKFWPMPKAPKDVGYTAQNYPYFPTKTFGEFYELNRRIEQDLARVTSPLLLMHSQHDKTASPLSSQIIYDRVGSQDKELVWFDRSGHEMMMDRDRERVFELIMAFVRKRAGAIA
jgi:carboxylesterase